jgi:hypothetical protein
VTNLALLLGQNGDFTASEAGFAVRLLGVTKVSKFTEY